MVSGLPTAAWVGRVLQERDDVHGQQSGARDQRGSRPGAEPAQPAECVTEDECGDAADGDAEDEYTGGEAAGGLHAPADEFLAAAVVVAVAVCLFEGDGRVDA